MQGYQSCSQPPDCLSPCTQHPHVSSHPSAEWKETLLAQPHRHPAGKQLPLFFFNFWTSVQSEQIEIFLYKIMKPYFLITPHVFLPKSSYYRLHYFCLFIVLRETQNLLKVH